MATVKQKLAVKKMVENGGNASKAMRDAGYSPMTAKSPSKLTESKGWNELMEQYLPDIKVLEAHNQGLVATKIHTSHTEPDKEVPDTPTRLRAVELAYKVKGRLSDSKAVIQVNNIIGTKRTDYGL